MFKKFMMTGLSVVLLSQSHSVFAMGGGLDDDAAANGGAASAAAAARVELDEELLRDIQEGVVPAIKPEELLSHIPLQDFTKEQQREFLMKIFSINDGQSGSELRKFARVASLVDRLEQIDFHGNLTPDQRLERFREFQYIYTPEPKQWDKIKRFVAERGHILTEDPIEKMRLHSHLALVAPRIFSSYVEGLVKLYSDPSLKPFLDKYDDDARRSKTDPFYKSIYTTDPDFFPIISEGIKSLDEEQSVTVVKSPLLLSNGKGVPFAREFVRMAKKFSSLAQGSFFVFDADAIEFDVSLTAEQMRQFTDSHSVEDFEDSKTLLDAVLQFDADNATPQEEEATADYSSRVVANDEAGEGSDCSLATSEPSPEGYVSDVDEAEASSDAESQSSVAGGKTEE